MEDLDSLIKRLDEWPEDREQIIRCGLLQAAQLIRAHQIALEKLADAMAGGTSTADFTRIIDAYVDVKELRQANDISEIPSNDRTGRTSPAT